MIALFGFTKFLVFDTSTQVSGILTLVSTIRAAPLIIGWNSVSENVRKKYTHFLLLPLISEHLFNPQCNDQLSTFDPNAELTSQNLFN